MSHQQPPAQEPMPQQGYQYPYSHAPAPQPHKKSHTFLKVVLGVIVGLMVVVVGCSVLVGTAVNEAVKDDKANAITVQEFKSIKKGMTIDEVKDLLGQPSSRQVSKSGGITQVSLYYPVDNDQFLDDYQFNFENGKLYSKADY